MITRLELKNYRAHKDTVLELSPFTLLVGPNGSGKSSVLEGLRFATGELNATGMEKHVRLGAGVGTIAARTDSAEKFGWVGWELPPGGHCMVSQTPLRPRSITLRLNATAIAKPGLLLAEALENNGVPRAEPDGSGTAVVVNYLESKEPARFQQLKDWLQRLIPNFEGLDTRAAPVPLEDGRTYVGWGLWFTFAGQGQLPAQLVSGGTLVATALLAQLLVTDLPALVLIDDIERDLHAEAQIELMKILTDLVRETQGLQMIATTHSPYVMDGVEAASIVVLATTVEGMIASASLNDHPKAAKMLDILSTGEFVSAYGERWVAERSAAVESG